MGRIFDHSTGRMHVIGGPALTASDYPIGISASDLAHELRENFHQENIPTAEQFQPLVRNFLVHQHKKHKAKLAGLDTVAKEHENAAGDMGSKIKALNNLRAVAGQREIGLHDRDLNVDRLDRQARAVVLGFEPEDELAQILAERQNSNDGLSVADVMKEMAQYMSSDPQSSGRNVVAASSGSSSRNTPKPFDPATDEMYQMMMEHNRAYGAASGK